GNREVELVPRGLDAPRDIDELARDWGHAVLAAGSRRGFRGVGDALAVGLLAEQRREQRVGALVADRAEVGDVAADAAHGRGLRHHALDAVVEYAAETAHGRLSVDREGPALRRARRDQPWMICRSSCSIVFDVVMVFEFAE